MDTEQKVTEAYVTAQENVEGSDRGQNVKRRTFENRTIEQVTNK